MLSITNAVLDRPTRHAPVGGSNAGNDGHNYIGHAYIGHNYTVDHRRSTTFADPHALLTSQRQAQGRAQTPTTVLVETTEDCC